MPTLETSLKPTRLKSRTPEARAFELAVKTGQLTVEDFPNDLHMRLLVRAIRADDQPA